MTQYRLQDMCESIIDCEHKTAPLDDAGAYFAVGTPAMRSNVIDYSQARRISKATFEEWTQRMRPRVGDLLLAREAPVGPVVKIPDSGNVAPGQRTVLLRPRSHLVESTFLYYLLISPAQQTQLAAKAAGSTVPHLNVADVREFELNLPPIAQQRGIAEVLGALDDKIAANIRLAHTVDELLATRFEQLGIDADPTNSMESASLQDFVELNPALPMPTVAEPTYVDMQKLPTRGSTVSAWERRPAKGGARFQNGDTLLARITPCLENRKTGFIDFLEEGEVALGSTEYIVLRSRPHVPRELSYFLAISARFREFAVRHMVGTSGRQRVSAADLAQISLRKPDLALLDKFGRDSGPAFATLRARRDESQVLAKMRDALLPELMSGRLQVRDAERIVSGSV